MEAVKEVSEVLSLDQTNLSKLYTEATKIQEKCSDFFVTKNASSSTTRLHFEGAKRTLSFLPDMGTTHKLPLSELSFGQLCTKLEVPSRYIDHCLKMGVTDLAEDNINYWLENYKGSLFIREYSGGIRGVLSNRFSVLDAPDIIESLAGFLEERGDKDTYKVKGFFLTPERFHARLISTEPLKGMNDPDLYTGFQIDSSDVGRSTLTVQFILYKKVCTNGLVIPKSRYTLFDQKHMGITSKSFVEGLDAFMTIPDLAEDVRGLVNSKSHVILDTGVDLPDLIKREDYMNFPLSSRLKAVLTKEEIMKVYNTMLEDYSATQWGLVNSITRVAQDYTLERRLALERYAGTVLTSRF